MRRVGTRVLMAVVGVTLLVLYLGVASVSYLVLVELWRARPAPGLALLYLAAFTLAFGYLSYRYGTARVLSGLDAVELPREYAPGLHRRLDRLCARMDVDRPRLLVARLGTPNALALGSRSDGVVVVDRSVFRLVDGPEFEALLAHELAHLESHDGLVQTLAYSAVRTAVGVVVLALLPALVVATGLARSAAWLTGRPTAWSASPLGRVRHRVGQAVLVVFVGLTLVVLAHSRRREFAADDRAVEVTGRPVALARALRKLERAADPGWGPLSTLYVHGDEERRLLRLFSTHPPMDERVERLLARARADRDAGGRRIPVR